MKRFFIFFLILTLPAIALERNKRLEQLFSTSIVKQKQIVLKEFSKAFNPSLIKYNDNLLLVFRHTPQSHISYIGVVLLNQSLEQISEPELLTIRTEDQKAPPQSEDARVFAYHNQLFLTYNDNVDEISRRNNKRRDIFVVQMEKEGKHFVARSSSKLMHETKYGTQMWQKNWVPFVWNNTLLFGYTIQPHEIIQPNLDTGICTTLYKTNTDITWPFGEMRGGTPAQLIDGEYLAFFHSAIKATSEASKGSNMWHYYMGAYTFSSEPPFEIKKVSLRPMLSKEFYKKSDSTKKVVFPGGYVVMDDTIYLAYGRDDQEIWIAMINKNELLSSLVPVTQKAELDQSQKISTRLEKR